ncbi:outer membrane protein assembly factor BamE [Alteromonas sp. LMIT006]|uniref:outer membrane protein assembly factor BamE n=1 Tax=Alteromonadaceae TaxID=72275 RepID=UPI0020CA3DFC|nr:outer membrane protein assembly factor BamE [Alteromonas sp. LMIT006]UTP72753.1 outer membrane protein assembly factor BamE [Alteromonas sp. LMIT006]
MSLNNHIVNLEKRVSQLEKQLKTPSQTIPVGNTQWRKLKRGMSMDSVKALLGEPLKIDGGYRTYYYYSKNSILGPHVLFIDDSVYGWEEPD